MLEILIDFLLDVLSLLWINFPEGELKLDEEFPIGAKYY
jgi:hypothetical protein